MKKILFLFILFLFTFNFKASAQSVIYESQLYNENNYILSDRLHENPCLGVWCTLTVSASNYQNGYYYCTMPVPPEGIPPYTKPMGIGAPSFQNHLGNTIDVVFSSDLVSDMMGATEGYFEFCVNKWIGSNGLYTTTNPGNGAPYCYYICIVRLSL